MMGGVEGNRHLVWALDPAGLLRPDPKPDSEGTAGSLTAYPQIRSGASDVSRAVLKRSKSPE